MNYNVLFFFLTYTIFLINVWYCSRRFCNVHAFAKNRNNKENITNVKKLLTCNIGNFNCWLHSKIFWADCCRRLLLLLLSWKSRIVFGKNFGKFRIDQKSSKFQNCPSLLHEENFQNRDFRRSQKMLLEKLYQKKILRNSTNWQISRNLNSRLQKPLIVRNVSVSN